MNRYSPFKKLVATIFLLIIISNLFAQNSIYHNGWIDLNKNGKKDIYEDPAQPIDDRVTDLISQMTIEEKTAQMVTLYGYGRVLKDEQPTPDWKNQLWKDGIGNIDEMLNNTTFVASCKTDYGYPYSKHTKAINTVQKWFIEETRLGIPVDFTNEGIRGLAHDRATCFPADIGIGSTWDKNLVRQMGEVIGEEAKILGYTNVYAPILDIVRDPRWGRSVESYGEDPFLVASLGTEMISGLQNQGVASTVKHFAVYSAPKGGRDGDVRTDPHITWREMHNLYLYPFEKAFRDADPLGVMSSYNDYDGVPVSGSDYFLTELLRLKYKFKGYVVSDSHAVEFLYTKHKVATDYKEAVRQCVEAGLNIRTNFTMPDEYVIPLRELVAEGKISTETINKRVADILRVKMILGLFDTPYIENPEMADKIVNSAEHQEVAKKASYESIVLLKNENQFLPLQKEKIKSILVTGNNAAAIKPMLSRYGPNNSKIISIVEGIKSKVGSDIDIKYTKGCETAPDNWLDLELIPESPAGSDKAMIDSAVAIAKTVDLAVVVLGDNETTVGESMSRTSLNLPGYQEDLLKAVYATGTPVVLVLLNGRAMTINWANKYVPAIFEAWFPGEFGGNAIADALFGDYNPGGKLSVTFPKTVGQIPFNFPFKPSSQAGQGNYKSMVLDALYPFGFGLSYTTFEYSNLNLDLDSVNSGGFIEVECTVKNTGRLAGDEVVQLYVKDMVSSVTVYETQLRGFVRVHLNVGESKTVKFRLVPEDLALINKDYYRVVEPGMFKILIGSSSTDIRLQKEFEITEGSSFCKNFGYYGMPK